MTYLLFAYVLGLVLPLFLRSWQTALFGLRAQGLALAGIVWLHGHGSEPGGILALIDLLLLRGLLAPSVLRRVALSRGIPRAFDLIPANLFVWTLAAILLMTSFGFAASLAGSHAYAMTHLGAASAGVLVALFILATQRTPLGQGVAVLTLENAIALFELHAHHTVEWGVQVGLLVVYALTLLTLRHLISRLGLVDTTPPQPKDTAIL